MTKYTPNPIDTAGIVLPSEINALTEKLAASTHDVWAIGKLKNNITDHPDLIPYEDLTEEKKDYDRNTAMETLKAVYALGYEISKIETHDDYPKDRDFVADHNRIDEAKKQDVKHKVW